MAISVRGLLAVLGLGCPFFIADAQAAKFSTIAAFQASDDGQYPYAQPVKLGNAVFGTTSSGGRYFSGTIYKMDLASGAVRTLYAFKGGADGAAPNALLKIGQKFFGTTHGDAEGDGTVFSFDPSTGKETVIYRFSGQDGSFPQGRLSQIDGVLYGLTVSGGASDNGVAFKFDPASGTETTLHSFSGGDDGQYPSSDLVQSGHFLYGTAQFGGSSADDGVLFKIDGATGKETLLHIFTGNDGAVPVGSLVLTGGILYGSTSYGGVNGWGSAYSYNLKTDAETVLHSFNYDANGYFPTGGLIDVAGVVYGTTSGGISPAGGTIFSIDLATSATTTLYSFPIGTTQGYGPEAALLDVGGLLYGTTGSGGITGGGTVFSFNPGSGVMTSLHDFTGVGPGQYSNGSLLQAGDVFYGTTPQGGASKLGSIFMLDPATKKIATLYSFAGGSTGFNPLAPLTMYGNELIGTTSSGNLASAAGAVFSFDPTTNMLTTILGFSATGATGDAANPNAPLLDVGGIFYGTSLGLNGGEIYSITPASGHETTLSAVPSQGYGTQPRGGGLLSFGGYLYGTSFYGGAHDDGSVFKTDPSSGATTIIYSFQDNTDGAKPAGGLVAVNGILYGTTTTGGTGYNGTLFSLDPSSLTLTTLHAFDAGSGCIPIATLLDIGGVLYGTTKAGGADGNGTVFAYDTSTSLYSTLHAFTGGDDGGAPQAALIDDNGVFYGTTSIGGAFNRGTAFRLVP